MRFGKIIFLIVQRTRAATISQVRRLGVVAISRQRRRLRFICSYAMYTSLRCHNRTNDIAVIARHLPNRKIVAQRNNQI